MSERDVPARRRALMIVNPKAREGVRGLSDINAVLELGGIDIVEAKPNGPDDLLAAIRQASDVDMIILGGGDGTLNSAAPAIIERGLPLGILPLGTANDLTRTLGIPAEPEAAAGIIADGRTRVIDVGSVNGVYFFNVASIGFSASLARGLTSEAKKRWGTLGYALAALNILTRSRPFTIDVEHDGISKKVRTVQISVGNGRFYGGGMAVAETATADDGTLDVYSLEVPNWWHLILLAPALRRGTQGRSRYVRTFSTTELKLSSRRRHQVNADGELVTRTPAHFKIHPQSVKVFVP